MTSARLNTSEARACKMTYNIKFDIEHQKLSVYCLVLLFFVTGKCKSQSWNMALAVWHQQIIKKGGEIQTGRVPACVALLHLRPRHQVPPSAPELLPLPPLPLLPLPPPPRPSMAGRGVGSVHGWSRGGPGDANDWKHSACARDVGFSSAYIRARG